MKPTKADREKAKEIYFKCLDVHGGILKILHPCGECVSQAIADERERCAKVAETYKPPGLIRNYDGEEIAVEIRKGEDKPDADKA